jgi:hypothetical protein
MKSFRLIFKLKNITPVVKDAKRHILTFKEFRFKKKSKGLS